MATLRNRNSTYIRNQDYLRAFDERLQRFLYALPSSNIRLLSYGSSLFFGPLHHISIPYITPSAGNHYTLTAQRRRSNPWIGGQRNSEPAAQPTALEWYPWRLTQKSGTDARRAARGSGLFIGPPSHRYTLEAWQEKLKIIQVRWTDPRSIPAGASRFLGPPSHTAILIPTPSAGNYYTLSAQRRRSNPWIGGQRLSEQAVLPTAWEWYPWRSIISSGTDAKRAYRGTVRFLGPPYGVAPIASEWTNVTRFVLSRGTDASHADRGLARFLPVQSHTALAPVDESLSRGYSLTPQRRRSKPWIGGPRISITPPAGTPRDNPYEFRVITQSYPHPAKISRGSGLFSVVQGRTAVAAPSDPTAGRGYFLRPVSLTRPIIGGRRIADTPAPPLPPYWASLYKFRSSSGTDARHAARGSTRFAGPGLTAVPTNWAAQHKFRVIQGTDSRIAHRGSTRIKSIPAWVETQLHWAQQFKLSIVQGTDATHAGRGSARFQGHLARHYTPQEWACLIRISKTVGYDSRLLPGGRVYFLGSQARHYTEIVEVGNPLMLTGLG